MKKMLFALSLITSQASFATILKSSLELRHQEVIEAAIEKECGYFADLTELKTDSEKVPVDNGIIDYKYSTLLTGLQRLDQNIFDRYSIVVDSDYSDMYDHSSKNWGVFSVSKVKCTME